MKVMKKTIRLVVPRNFAPSSSGHAVCVKLAAEIYNMNILAEGIETNKRNFTRFLILAILSPLKF